MHEQNKNDEKAGQSVALSSFRVVKCFLCRNRYVCFTSLLKCHDSGAEIKPGPRPGRNSCDKLSNYSSFPMYSISVQHTRYNVCRSKKVSK